MEPNPRIVNIHAAWLRKQGRDRISLVPDVFCLEVGSWPFAFFLYVNLSLRNEKRETRLSSLLNPSFRFINRLVNINNLN